jgi:hypothetical protein
MAFLRKKQWWSFEGLDEKNSLYYVFLALKAFPTDYVSYKVIDYKNGLRFTRDFLGKIQAESGKEVSVHAGGRWGNLTFRGHNTSDWNIEIRTEEIQAEITQRPVFQMHQNWLLTRYIDYHINQFPLTESIGLIQTPDKTYEVNGYGYYEHNWGIQPRHSTAHWLHFWMPDFAGIVLNCYYDAGVPHQYTYFNKGGIEAYLSSPAQFFYDPDNPENEWKVRSKDLDLILHPVYTHHTKFQIPPVFAYTSIDYHEQLVRVKGTAIMNRQEMDIDSIGKYDHNFNLW